MFGGLVSYQAHYPCLQIWALAIHFSKLIYDFLFLTPWRALLECISSNVGQHTEWYPEAENVISCCWSVCLSGENWNRVSICISVWVFWSIWNCPTCLGPLLYHSQGTIKKWILITQVLSTLCCGISTIQLWQILAGLLDQHTFAGNPQALKMVTWMVDYFYNRVQNVITKYTVNRHYQSMNEETGGMNDVLYRLYSITVS